MEANGHKLGVSHHRNMQWLNFAQTIDLECLACLEQRFDKIPNLAKPRLWSGSSPFQMCCDPLVGL